MTTEIPAGWAINRDPASRLAAMNFSRPLAVGHDDGTGDVGRVAAQQRGDQTGQLWPPVSRAAGAAGPSAGAASG